MGSLNKGVVEVSAAVCVRDGKVFAAQRGGAGELAYRWEFPGGKLEAEESPEQALTREISEELNARIEILKPIMTVEHRYDTFSIRLHGFLCGLLPDEKFIISEHVDGRWLSADELSSVDWSDADLSLVEWVGRYLHGLS